MSEQKTVFLTPSVGFTAGFVADGAQNWQHELVVRGSGTVGATVEIYGSMSGDVSLGRELIGTLTVAGTAPQKTNTPPLNHSWSHITYTVTDGSGVITSAYVSARGV